MTALARTLGVARFTCQTAFRSRRAIVTALLFAAVGAGVMYLMIGVYAAIEREVVSVLMLPETDGATGAVTMTLWKSKSFANGVAHFVGNSLVFNDIRTQHPIVLAFAGIVFSAVPMLTLLVSAPTAAGEVRSGSVRYLLLRVTRTEWSLGLFLGEATVLLASMVLMALAAGGVAMGRLSGWAGLSLFPALLVWSVRAWVYALAWLGVCLGASLVAKTPGKATALAMLVMMVLSALSVTAGECAPWLDLVRPQGYFSPMWRGSCAALFEGVVGLLAVAFLYLGLGAAVFARRDV